MMTNTLTSLLILFPSDRDSIVALVFGILLALSYLGGWGALARMYESTPRPTRHPVGREKAAQSLGRAEHIRDAGHSALF